ncbi:MAG: glycyl-radical enzyme activating protein [Atopobiaceae bacterium]|nr:glycyl-radical enzyme activating protein [Atopobiaceae bacterium]
MGDIEGATRAADEGTVLLVMNLERFATHDGPGIRTVVFLKGCPLHCPWCANPETQMAGPVVFHDVRRCVGCAACERACPAGAITMREDADGSPCPSFDLGRCDGCGACERACLHEAIALQGRRRSVRAVLDEVLRDADYYEASGGGLTVSGGEPLAVPAQVMPLLREAKARGLDTAIETCGNVPLDIIEEAEPLVDHFLYDLKHLDDRVLARVTGGDGVLIKGNLAWLARRCPQKVNAHIPVIPGFNYDAGVLRPMIGWLHEVGVTRVNLLPYHTLGLAKYEKLHRAYDLPRQGLADKDLMPYHEYALSLGMESRIGS